MNNDWIAYASRHLRYNDIDNAFLATNRVEIIVGMMKRFRISLAPSQECRGGRYPETHEATYH